MSASPILARAIRGELGLHGVAEVRHELGCFLVAVRFGQGGEPRDIGEEESRRRRPRVVFKH